MSGEMTKSQYFKHTVEKFQDLTDKVLDAPVKDNTRIPLLRQHYIEANKYLGHVFTIAYPNGISGKLKRLSEGVKSGITRKISRRDLILKGFRVDENATAKLSLQGLTQQIYESLAVDRLGINIEYTISEYNRDKDEKKLIDQNLFFIETPLTTVEWFAERMPWSAHDKKWAEGLKDDKYFLERLEKRGNLYVPLAKEYNGEDL